MGNVNEGEKDEEIPPTSIIRARVCKYIKTSSSTKRKMASKAKTTPSTQENFWDRQDISNSQSTPRHSQ